jgi:N-acetylmuramoyl-L-alanine amidase
MESWCAASGFGFLRHLPFNGQWRYELRTARGVFGFALGSRIASWEGIGFALGFAPLSRHGQLCLHTLDLQKSFLPLLNVPKAGLKAGTTIVLDPGHGGRNPGARNVWNDHLEKEFTLDWARRIQRLLAAHGWRVFLTRTNDVDIALSNRVALAESVRADLFLSLHFNSVANADGPTGIETYCLTPAGMPSSLIREFEDDPVLVFPNNAFDVQNFQYAVHLHRALVMATSTRDRLVQRARFLGVLRQQSRPAVLIEGGYLSNPREARRIADPQYRQLLSEAVARSLVEMSLWPVPVVDNLPGTLPGFSPERLALFVAPVSTRKDE